MDADKEIGEVDSVCGNFRPAPLMFVSCGKPAIGVGPGNTPAWVCADADVGQAAASIVASKSFDHGVTCGSEQHVVVDAFVRAAPSSPATAL